MRLLASLLTAVVICACSDPSAPLVARNIEITAPVPGANMSAGYLTLSNNTDAAITINQVTSPQFGRVEIHESSVENGVARMRQTPQIRIEAGESLVFTRGGLHLMLMQPEKNVEAVTLVFYSDDAPVLSISTAIPD